MFLAIIFLAAGLALLLNALGIISGSFWQFFWAIVLIVIGVKIINSKKICPVCKWHFGKHGHCNCECDCGCEYCGGKAAEGNEREKEHNLNQ